MQSSSLPPPPRSLSWLLLLWLTSCSPAVLAAACPWRPRVPLPLPLPARSAAASCGPSERRPPATPPASRSGCSSSSRHEEHHHAGLSPLTTHIPAAARGGVAVRPWCSCPGTWRQTGPPTASPAPHCCPHHPPPLPQPCLRRRCDGCYCCCRPCWRRGGPWARPGRGSRWGHARGRRRAAAWRARRRRRGQQGPCRRPRWTGRTATPPAAA